MKIVDGLIILGMCLQGVMGCSSGGVSRDDTKTRIIIQYAVVESAEAVQYESQAGKSAAVGGLWGLVAGAGGDRGDMASGALAGAALLGLTTKIMEGSNKGTSYTLKDAKTNSVFKVITDDQHVQVGDCVSVETGRTTNVRHVSQEQCQPPLNHPVESDIAAKNMADAQECDQAKQALLKATGDELDAAIKKVKVLCQH